jgi:hypothetical protein
MIKKCGTAIRTACIVFSIVMMFVGIAGNMRRHKSHDEHDKTCECLQGCYECTIAAARGN